MAISYKSGILGLKCWNKLFKALLGSFNVMYSK